MNDFVSNQNFIYLPIERMGVEYQRFDGKEYVSLKRYNNLLCKCKDLEEKNKEMNEKYDGLWKIYTEDVKERVEENDKLKMHIEAKDKAYMDLLADYNYLKARIKKTERAFLKYEEKQEKLLGDLDMIVMNR